MARLEIGDRVRAAAMDAGILPNDPMGPMIEAVADLPAEVELRIAPVLAEMRAFTAAAKQAAEKPVMTKDQIRWTLVPALLAARDVWQIVALGVMVAFGLVVGIVLDRVYLSPPPDLSCGPIFQNRPICYRFDGPEIVQPPQEQPDPPPASAPATQLTPLRGKPH